MDYIYKNPVEIVQLTKEIQAANFECTGIGVLTRKRGEDGIWVTVPRYITVHGNTEFSNEIQTIINNHVAIDATRLSPDLEIE
mgnify:CR=1 FL=1